MDRRFSGLNRPLLGPEKCTIGFNARHRGIRRAPAASGPALAVDLPAGDRSLTIPGRPVSAEPTSSV